MWWNFIGRSHDEVVAAREEWESGADGSVAGPSDGSRGTPVRWGASRRRRCPGCGCGRGATGRVATEQRVTGCRWSRHRRCPEASRPDGSRYPTAS
ncbi:hypothetical protein [Phycicoccus sp. HDW14]|uniref:hypothetical protein n=1 Tax=Phycicoccus sp. HDW14 TaxID=2714941 RepID=UPI0035304429